MNTLNRSFDVLIYGASGFTGAKIAKYLFDNCPALNWAIAGRSESKLKKILSELNSSGSSSLKILPRIVIADATDKDSLHLAFSQTKLVLNCTGPYRFLGPPIVEACLNSESDYMDICGEPQFMEEMFLKYNDEAIAKNVLILHACAFDSVPADLGVLFTMRRFSPRCCSSIESFLTIICGQAGFAGHYTTYECAVHGLGDVTSLRKTRSAVVDKYHPPEIVHVGPKLKRESGFFFEQRLKKYAFPFMGADASVVKGSQRSIAMSSGDVVWPQYAAYATIDTWGWMATTAVYGSIFQTLSKFAIGRSLLLQYPKVFSNGIFSHNGPTDEQLETTSFCMKFYARGFDEERTGSSTARTTDKEVVVAVTGPEPGYVVTPRILVALAETLLQERKTAMPAGGVMTPAAAFFRSTVVFSRLADAGIEFKEEPLKE